MIRSEFMAAINQICSERGIESQVVLDTLKHAIKAAYHKDYTEEIKEETEEDTLEIRIDEETGGVSVWEDGKDITPPGFGRIAAQTAKQVILQGVREAEKSAIMDEYSTKVGNVVSGMLQRREGPDWIVDLGRTTGLLPRSEQVSTDNYRHNQRLRFYVKEIRQFNNRYEIIVSRTAEELLTGLFHQEIPEISSGSIEIKSVAREPGQRSKVAVKSLQEGVDPVGSCVGQRGIRVQAVTDELNGERIDIILWNEDPQKFVAAALSPAEVKKIKINEETATASIRVPEEQVSLAIGKEGQNARLAAKLTGYRIDISCTSDQDKIDLALSQAEIPQSIQNKIDKAGTSWTELSQMDQETINNLPGIGAKTTKQITELLKEINLPQPNTSEEPTPDLSEIKTENTTEENTELSEELAENEIKEITETEESSDEGEEKTN